MCGICGEIRFDGQPASAAVVQKMLGSLASRGPDGVGVHTQGPRAFGQRRLKIIDLSDAAQQPMIDSELGLGVVYNGAIYNYKELRTELEGQGYQFFSRGDTEVLLKAYHAWGRDFVKRLSGMFAFALWERDSGRVVLGRDRLGIKPLYYMAHGQQLRFASTLPALLAAGDASPDIDPIALHYYMTFHSVVPAPWTILEGIHKVPPATVYEIDGTGRRTEYRYWHARFPSEEGAGRTRSLDDWRSEVLQVLKRSVGRRLVADVPVGVLLSGGIDSSLVTALMAREHGHPTITFSIGFDPVGSTPGDEFEYSDPVAREFSQSHHRIRIPPGRMLEALPACVEAMSEPMVSHDVIGFFLLSEEVSRHVRVVQSGQGADEIFGGYSWYPRILASDGEPDGAGAYARHFFDRDHAEFTQAVHPRFVQEDHSSGFVQDHFETAAASRTIDKALHIDTTVMLVEDPVKRVDNTTMAWGLEARVPFLDHELVELACRIPAELKVCNGGKHVLKEAARGILPAEIIDRPKGYFPVPALKHLRGEPLDLVRSVLQDRRTQHRELFDPAYIGTLLEAPEDHLTPLGGSKLWQTAVLEMWLRSHEI